MILRAGGDFGPRARSEGQAAEEPEEEEEGEGEEPEAEEDAPAGAEVHLAAETGRLVAEALDLAVDADGVGAEAAELCRGVLVGDGGRGLGGLGVGHGGASLGHDGAGRGVRIIARLSMVSFLTGHLQSAGLMCGRKIVSSRLTADFVYAH